MTVEIYSIVTCIISIFFKNTGSSPNSVLKVKFVLAPNNNAINFLSEHKQFIQTGDLLINLQFGENETFWISRFLKTKSVNDSCGQF